MLSGHIQGMFLTSLVKMMQPKAVLEIGTYTGYSAICLAEGLPEDGTLDTIEVDVELEDIIRKYFLQYPKKEKITLHIGDALEVIPTLDKTYDLIFMDADKEYSTAEVAEGIGLKGSRTRQLLKELIDLGEIDSVGIYTYKLAVSGHDHTRVKGISSAKLSTPFSVALGLVMGNAGPDDFNEANLNDPAITALSGKVSVFEDEQLTARSPAVRGARVVIRLKSGESWEKTVLYPKGEPENPVSDDEIRQKAQALIRNYKSNGYTDRILEKLWD